MTIVIRYRYFSYQVVFALLLATPMAAMASVKYKTNMDHSGLAVAIDRALPASPLQDSHENQEAWVQMSYVVAPDGRAIDPIIINSSGGVDFENEVRKVSQSWRFVPPDTGAELPFNVSNSRFTVRGQGKGSTERFGRYAQRIMQNLNDGDVKAARKVADAAAKSGGWNLYESTMLWLMVGRVAGAEGDDAGKLEM